MYRTCNRRFPINLTNGKTVGVGQPHSTTKQWCPHTSQHHKTVVSTPRKSLRQPKNSPALCTRAKIHIGRERMLYFVILILHQTYDLCNSVKYSTTCNSTVYSCTVYTKHCVSPSHQTCILLGTRCCTGARSIRARRHLVPCDPSYPLLLILHGADNH